MLADDVNIQVINGTAQFVSNHQVAVRTVENEEVVYEAQRTFINTGVQAVIPKVTGLQLSEK